MMHTEGRQVQPLPQALERPAARRMPAPFVRAALGAGACAALLLGGCASHGEAPALYDFGAPPAGAPAAMPTGTMPAALVVAEVNGPAALDSQSMFYRLNYADPLQARAYANNHWSGTPLQLITQRFKTRFAQTGMKVLSLSDAAAGMPLLRVEVDDFSQGFDSPGQSHGQLLLRASLFQGRKLIAQESFASKVPARSADAAGGARALAEATDAVAANILAWVAALPPRKE
ncbi:MAG: ABC-type transport auxiliary lipoprotein family protein [Pseudomonadota bacterium]